MTSRIMEIRSSSGKETTVTVNVVSRVRSDVVTRTASDMRKGQTHVEIETWNGYYQAATK